MSAPTTYSFDLYADNVLNANTMGGKHWGTHDDAKATLRTLGATHARVHGIPRFERVDMFVVVSYPSRRIQDVMNLYPTMKAYLDGLANGLPRYEMEMRNGKPRKKLLASDPETGIVPDDNDLFVVGPHLSWSGRLSTRPRHFQFDITLTPLEPLIPEADALAPSLALRYPHLAGGPRQDALL